MTGQVMVRNSLKDSFVSQVSHPFTSLNSLFYLVFLTFFNLSSLVGTLVCPFPADAINPSPDRNEIFTLVQSG